MPMALPFLCSFIRPFIPSFPYFPEVLTGMHHYSQFRFLFCPLHVSWFSSSSLISICANLYSLTSTMVCFVLSSPWLPLTILVLCVFLCQTIPLVLDSSILLWWGNTLVNKLTRDKACFVYGFGNPWFLLVSAEIAHYGKRVWQNKIFTLCLRK